MGRGLRALAVGAGIGRLVRSAGAWHLIRDTIPEMLSWHPRRLWSLREVQYEEAMRRLDALSNPEAVEGMARYGIRSERVYGVSVPTLRRMAKEIGKDHDLAQQLWTSGVLEARELACLIDDPRQVTEAQMERWVADFDSWALCDGCCSNLFDRTELAYRKAVEWSGREEEFVKRAGFALMAAVAVHDKVAPDDRFREFLPIIKRESSDDRNFVKKAASWALRSIGKRNLALNSAAIGMAEEIKDTGSKSGRWIASDALRELTQEKVQARLRAKGR